MSFLDRFRRNKQDSVLPEEVKEYYQSERRQKRSVAIGLALVALLVTIAIAAGLFFAGRFVVNKIKGDDDKKDQGTAQQEIQEEASETQGENPRDQQAQGQSPNPAPAPAPQPTPAPAPSNPTTPSLGDEPLPHTGDEGM